MTSKISPAMENKLARLRRNAQKELPKTRLCAEVIHAILLYEDKEAAAASIGKMQKKLGIGWSTTSSIQFMSGRQAEFAAECGLPDEKLFLYRAHLVAKMISHEAGLGNAPNVNVLDISKLRALASKIPAHADKLPNSASFDPKCSHPE